MKRRYFVVPALLCVAALATSRVTGNMDRVQECLNTFDAATNCFITLHDEKYGEGCRALQPDESPPCIRVGWRLCNAAVGPPPWHPEGP